MAVECDLGVKCALWVFGTKPSGSAHILLRKSSSMAAYCKHVLLNGSFKGRLHTWGMSCGDGLCFGGETCTHEWFFSMILLKNYLKVAVTYGVRLVGVGLWFGVYFAFGLRCLIKNIMLNDALSQKTGFTIGQLESR